MHIVFAASECVPFAKTGGLADVVGALAPELVKLGHEVTVYLPLYAGVRRQLRGRMDLCGAAPSPFLSRTTTASRALWTAASAAECSTTLWIARRLFDRQGLYGTGGGRLSGQLPSASRFFAAR